MPKADEYVNPTVGLVPTKLNERMDLNGLVDDIQRPVGDIQRPANDIQRPAGDIRRPADDLTTFEIEFTRDHFNPNECPI